MQWRLLAYTIGIPTLSWSHVSRDHYRHVASASMKHGDGGLKPRPVDDEMAGRHRHCDRPSRRASLAVGKSDHEPLVTLDRHFFHLLVQEHADDLSRGCDVRGTPHQ